MKMAATSLAVLAAIALAQTASAGPILFSGTNGDQAATAEITLGNGTVTVKVSNDTPTTESSNDVLTKFTVDISGLTGGSVTSGTSLLSREVASDGTFLESPGVDLLALNTWSASIVGDTLSFNFNPNAEYGLLGVDTAGTYSGANGSIKGNAGHNPFSYGDVTFTFAATGVTENSQLSDVRFYFGTDFSTDIPGGGVPEPASLGILALGAVGLLARRRR